MGISEEESIRRLTNEKMLLVIRRNGWQLFLLSTLLSCCFTSMNWAY